MQSVLFALLKRFGKFLTLLALGWGRGVDMEEGEVWGTGEEEGEGGAPGPLRRRDKARRSPPRE